jgi:serine/threonine protein kinase
MIRRGHLSTGETADIGATLAGALAYVHAQGVVHRDVKPANILVDVEGHARLADFGIARLVDTSSVTLAGTMIGTATYMAPEQIEDHAVGPSADVWALGIVLLESLTGERVYVGTPSEVIARRLAGPVTLPEGLPVPWRLLFSGMLALEPDNRLSASEVQAMLSTPAFRTPWDPSTSTGDITTIAGSPMLSRGASADETVVRPANVSVMTRQPTPNAVNIRRGWRALAISSVVIVVGAGVAFAFGTGNHHPPPTTTTPPTTTSTSTSTTTTTTLPSPSRALTSFINDVVAGQSARLIGPQDGQSLSMGAQQAVTDASNGNADLAATDLQQVATTIASGVSGGHIAKATGVQLQSDLTTLAKALGLGAAATPSSTTSTTSSTSTTTPGFGNGNGNGNGFGPGN